MRPWIKLWAKDVFFDPKIGTLPVNLKWRYFEANMLAGYADEGGFLPPLDQIAYMVRDSQETVNRDYYQLANVGLLALRPFGDQANDGSAEDNFRWFVNDFADRQSPMSGKERTQLSRENKKNPKKKKEEEKNIYREESNVTECVTKRYTNVTQVEVDEGGCEISGFEVKVANTLMGIAHDPETAQKLMRVINELADHAHWQRPSVSGDRDLELASQNWWQPICHVLALYQGDEAKSLESLRVALGALRSRNFTPGSPKALIAQVSANVEAEKSGATNNGFVYQQNENSKRGRFSGGNDKANGATFVPPSFPIVTSQN